MSDPATVARNARELLSRGLSALQSDPSVPPHLLDLAAPVAQAMGALHQIERSNGTQLVPHAQVALDAVRSALSQLQAQAHVHPAVGTAVESVAGSLSQVHALSRLAAPAPAPQAAAPAYAPPQQAYAPPPQPQAPPQGYAPAAQQAYAPPQQQQQHGYAPAQQQQPSFPQAARDPFAAPAASPGPKQPSIPVPSPAAVGNAPVVEADLGAQSFTNFYKGLSGNDIIDHGGLFVSTYKLLKIGAPVRLKVSLPGGYEFMANAIVRWCREPNDASSDAPPGFGAQFTEISPEARQLVYRYVRNREPLFHDDL